MSHKFNKPIILGSSSVHRKKVLEDLGIPFSIMSPNIDEKALSRLGGGSQAVTARIARAKAQALLDRIRALEPPLPPSFLITSDQVVVHKGTIREKPETGEECRRYLESYREWPATCVSSVCVVDTATEKILEGTATATQYFTDLNDSIIQQLIDQGVVMTCAGGFAVECIHKHAYNIYKTVLQYNGYPDPL